MKSNSTSGLPLRVATAVRAAGLAVSAWGALALAALGVVALAGLTAHAAEAAPIPEPRLPERVEPITLPPVTMGFLANGLQVVVVERPQRPLAQVLLTIPGGHVHDPPQRPGLAGFVADMLRQGTKSRSAREIDSLIDSVGGSLSASAGVEATTITVRVLARDLERAVELAADIAVNPTFPDAEIEIQRPQWLAEVRSQFDDPGTLARLHADTWLYGPSHPLGLFPSEQAVRAVTRDDLVAFHQQRYTPQGALLLVVGDVRPEEVMELARRHLGSWQARSPTRQPVPTPELSASRVRFVEWPGQTQLRIELRQPGPAATVEDWPAVQLFNYVLGGGAFASRLMDVVRVRLGQTYDVRTSYAGYRFPSHFGLSTFTRNDLAWETLRVLESELERFVREGVTEQEVQDAKGFLIFGYPMRLETLGGMASSIFQALWLGRGLAWVSDYPVLLNRLSVPEINAAIRRHLDPNRFAVTLLGDPSVLERAPDTIWGVPRERIERIGRTHVPAS